MVPSERVKSFNVFLVSRPWIAVSYNTDDRVNEANRLRRELEYVASSRFHE